MICKNSVFSANIFKCNGIFNRFFGRFNVRKEQFSLFADAKSSKNVP